MPKVSTENEMKPLVDAATEKGSREIDAMLGAYLCLCTLESRARVRVMQWLSASLADNCRDPEDELPF